MPDGCAGRFEAFWGQFGVKSGLGHVQGEHQDEGQDQGQDQGFISNFAIDCLLFTQPPTEP